MLSLHATAIMRLTLLPTQPSLCCSQVGDETLSVMEIWGAEYQENDCLLIKPDARDALQAICDRERCLMQVRLCLTGAWVHADGWDGAPGGPHSLAWSWPLRCAVMLTQNIHVRLLTYGYEYNIFCC